MKYIKYILSAAVCLSAAIGLTAEDKAFNEARIYVNPGHEPVPRPVLLPVSHAYRRRKPRPEYGH